MRYEAIITFADMQDNNHIYHAGDTYPRVGLSVNEERIKELAGTQNRAKRAVIKAVEENPDGTQTTTRKRRKKD